MHPMYLFTVEQHPHAGGPFADAARFLGSVGAPVPQILHLFAYKPAATKHLAQFTQAVMRGPSPLSPGMRELIAAVTSKGNHCLF
jgi:alkylhydroperoxidase family enzyme